MIRTQISLTAEDRRLLDGEAARTGRSVSSLIREAVRKTYAQTHDPDADIAAITAAAGAWNDRDLDGEGYVERLRSGRRLDEVAAR